MKFKFKKVILKNWFVENQILYKTNIYIGFWLGNSNKQSKSENFIYNNKINFFAVMCIIL